MTRLFIQFYVGVLIVLFLAWYIHGRVAQKRSDTDRARVVTFAHAGGARLVAAELNAARSAKQRKHTLQTLQQQFDYPLEITTLDALSEDARRQIRRGSDVAYDANSVVALLASDNELVRLGPFPNYRGQEIDASLAGWMRLTKAKLDAKTPPQRASVLAELQKQFDVGLEIAATSQLPQDTHQRLVRGDVELAFYSPAGEQWFSAIPLSDPQQVIRFGPFRSFEDIEQKAATTTLGLVLLPAALAIAILLRPVARQLRQVEHAAKAIAAGDLSTRVNEKNMNSAKPLAAAFNHMASRTESLVRTQRELLQAVSHELRTPLSRMRFAIDLIATAKDDDERQQRLESLDAATEELDELVGELLSYVRMETTEHKVEPEDVAVRDALADVSGKYATLHPHVAFNIDDRVDQRHVVFADRHGFLRVMGNLLSNAGRFASSQVVATAESADGTTIVTVDDDGPGIPEADRDRVFEPFVRLEKADGKDCQGRGVGLGLTLVQRILTQNGASIEILESPLGGCRVRTRWPRTSHETPIADSL